MIISAPRRFAVTNIWLLYRAQWLLAQLLRQDRKSLSTTVAPVAGHSGNHWIFGRVSGLVSNSEPPSEVSQCWDLAFACIGLSSPYSIPYSFISLKVLMAISFVGWKQVIIWRKDMFPAQQQPPPPHQSCWPAAAARYCRIHRHNKAISGERPAPRCPLTGIDQKIGIQSGWKWTWKFHCNTAQNSKELMFWWYDTFIIFHIIELNSFTQK